MGDFFMIETLIRPLEKTCQTVLGILENKCQRCGAIVDLDNRDGYGQLYCRECLAFGKITEKTTLFRYERIIARKAHTLILPFTLSKKQNEASRFVVNCLNQKQIGFLHAVCGAGKTEILYAGMLDTLKKGERICFAIPRRDIVNDIVLRLKSVFPNSVIKPLHANAKDDDNADIVVSTIHQLIRYYHEFDVIILDEIDAFPFRGDPLLHRLVKKALTIDGVSFLMSATIDSELAQRIHRGLIKTFTISARFHGQSLDIPQIINVMELNTIIQKDHNLPAVIIKWLNYQQNNQIQVLMFVPTIKYGILLTETLRLKGFLATFVSSKSNDTTYVIDHFRKAKWNVLVTTTILERGVTFSNVAVAVMATDNQIFDIDTLVQICGRVGRSWEFPHGEIVYFCEEKTTAIIKSIRYIKKMNRQGKREGLLNNGMPNLR